MGSKKVVAGDAITHAGNFGVFLSWSGNSSRQIAEALSLLIPNVFQDTQTFVSSNDIDAGSNWFGRILSELADTEFGIICLTADNISKPWINFEAGALANRIRDRARAVPYLHGIASSDLQPPLSLFQGVKADKRGTLSLLQSLNGVRSKKFEKAKLEEIFEKWWPELEQKLKLVQGPSDSIPAARTEREFLEEILAILRGSQATSQLLSEADRISQTSRSSMDAATTNQALRVQLLVKIAELQQLQSSGVPIKDEYFLDEIKRKLDAELTRIPR